MKLRDLVSALLKVAGMWALLETLMQAPATISTATYMSSQPGVSYPWIPVAALSVIRLAAIGILLFAGDRLAQIIVPADADTDVAGILSRPQAAFETGTRLTGVVVRHSGLPIWRPPSRRCWLLAEVRKRTPSAAGQRPSQGASSRSR